MQVASNACALAYALFQPHIELVRQLSLDVNQYAHKTWRVNEGFSKGFIRSIAQTADGYLWLGPELDGQIIEALLEDREGTIWVAGWSSRRSLQCPR